MRPGWKAQIRAPIVGMASPAGLKVSPFRTIIVLEFRFHNVIKYSILHVPAGIRVEWDGRELTTGNAAFGAQQAIHGDTEIVLAEPIGACTSLSNTNASGKIVLIQRSGTAGCTFVEKATNAQNAGAIAAIVYNNDGAFLHQMTGSSPDITVPVLFIGQADGERLATTINAGTTTVALRAGASICFYLLLRMSLGSQHMHPELYRAIVLPGPSQGLATCKLQS